MNKIKQGGVIIIQPAKEDAQYHKVFKIGAIKTESYDWKLYRPQFEKQGNTYDCVSFSRCNCGEYVARKAGACDEEGKELNFSDLHLAVESNTSQNGNDLNSPSEAFRKKGIVIEKYCDYDEDMLSNPIDTWEKRQMKVNEILTDTRRYFGGNHSWVNPIKAVMMDALDFSPLQIAVGVDSHYEEKIVPRCDNPSGYHAITLEKINADGTYRIFDSVLREEKLLASDYKILQVKSFRDLPESWKLTQAQKEKSILSIIGELLKKLAQVLGLMQKQVELLPNPPPQPPPQPPQPPPVQSSSEWGKYDESAKLMLVGQIKEICKKNGLTDQMTIDVIRTIWAESGINPFCVNETTFDYGLCQFSARYYLKEYKMTPQEAIENPLRCVDIMSKNFKAGRANNWIAFLNGNYKKAPSKYYV